MAHPGGIDADYARWKTSCLFCTTGSVTTVSCGPRFRADGARSSSASEFKHKQRLYLSEQTDGSATHPNTLVVTNVDVVKRRVAAAEHLIFEEESRSPFVKSWKKIIHPGEVNKIREFESQPNLVVTHTDAPELFVWDTDKQPHRKTGPSAADAKDERDRTGAPPSPTSSSSGTKNAEFALAVRRETFDVASGGKDAQVLLWSVADHDNGAVWRDPERPAASPTRRSSGVGARSGRFRRRGGARASKSSRTRRHGGGRRVPPRRGISAVQRGVRSLAHLLGRPRGERTRAQGGGGARGRLTLRGLVLLDEHAVLTGSADRAVKLWDRRGWARRGTRAACTHVRRAHRGYHHRAVVPGSEGRVRERRGGWLPQRVGRREGGGAADGGQKKTAPPELLFQHAGHRSQVSDFQWNPLDPWTIAGVSSGDGGNTLQMWRMNDLIYRPEEEALAELEKHKVVICGAKRTAAAEEGGDAGEDTEGGGEGDAMAE